MNVQVLDRTGAPPRSAAALAIADCDIHPYPKSIKKDLFPFLPQRWQAHYETYGMLRRQGFQSGPAYPKGQPDAARRDAYPPSGGKPGSDLAFMRKQHLDPNNVRLGILNPLQSGQGLQNADFAAAYCRAVNEWQIAEWTSKEPRLKASVMTHYEDGVGAEAVFERFPRLKVVLVEAGFAWVPPLAWRLDKIWHRMRDETPHLKRPPSEYIREHVRLTTQPMEEPQPRKHLLDTIEWIGWDRLLFATDYPHWDYDDPAHALPAGVGEQERRMFFFENAAKVYGR